MSEDEIILTIVNMAGEGKKLKASEAVRLIAKLAHSLDEANEEYAQKLDALLNIGATVWSVTRT